MTTKIKKMRKEVKSEFFPKNIIDQLNDKKPMFSILLLAMVIVENCYKGEYMFRSNSMKKRLKEHGALPKSFFRQNFQRSSKLLKLLIVTKMTLDDLTEKVVENDRFEKVYIFDRKENKTFYKLKPQNNED